jgi:hypothetical protein
VYVAGISDATWGIPIRAFTPNGIRPDAFAAKLNASGELSWNTFLGASDHDYGFKVRVDASGDVTFVGTSGTGWGTPVRAYTSSDDAFVARLNTNGDLLWHTFLGGTGLDSGRDVVRAASGNLYIAGGTAFQSWGTPLRPYSGGMDAYVAKLPPDKTYADTAVTCGGNIPCYSTIGGALGGVMDTVGVVDVYPATYTENVSLGAGVTANLLGATTLNGDLDIGAGTTLNATSANFTLNGNFTRSGTFNHNNGAVIFAKSGTQSVSNNVTLNDMTVNDGVMVDVGTNTLTVQGDETCIGSMRRSAPAQDVTTGGGTVSYTDPIGVKTTDLTSTGAASLGSTGIVITAHQSPPACGSGQFTSAMVLRHFNITPANTSGVTATVRLYYPDDEANAIDPDAVVMYHCDGTRWQELSGEYARGTDAETGYAYVELPGVTSFSAFALGPSGLPTADELGTFTAHLTNAMRVKVKWTTASEMNLVGFNLWRRQGKQDEFQKLNADLIPAQHPGTMTGAEYEYTDDAIQPGKVHRYKLELVRASGAPGWSEVVKVEVPAACAGAPAQPILTAPKDGKTVKNLHVNLEWEPAACAETYEVIVRRGSADGKIVDEIKGLTATQYKTKALKAGKTYYWQVRAYNGDMRGKWSKAQSFTVGEK